LMIDTSKAIQVLGLPESIRKAENFAKFGKPIDDDDLRYLAGRGLKDAAHRASNCMGWTWRQWLKGASKDLLSSRVEPFVERGLELRDRSQSYDYLPLHDLFLLHCAIFATSDSLLKTVSQRVADASGDKGSSPEDNGELYAAAWSGMMKYWILGDDEKAVQQADLIWGAYREPGVLAAPKVLVTPWLKRDWDRFRKAQESDFQKLWNRARKDAWTVRAESSSEIVVTTERYQIEHHWCWAHCGMALLAHRQGVEVVTDPFWFPSTAVVGPTKLTTGQLHLSPDQLKMF
jgi:hypothetical protein